MRSRPLLATLLFAFSLGAALPAHAEGLHGRVFDLKRTKNGTPSKLIPVKEGGKKPVTVDDVLEILKKFYKAWDTKQLAKYYQVKVDLQDSYFYLPPMPDELIPPTITSNASLKPRFLLFLYKGYVKAPESGTYRFIGMANDGMLVRFNNQDVLEAGYLMPSLYSKKTRDAHLATHRFSMSTFLKSIPHLKDYDQVQIDGCTYWNTDLNGLLAGNTFQVKAGEVYPISISYFFLSGGERVGLALYIEKVDGKSSSKKGYNLFRTDSSLPDKQSIINRYRVTKHLYFPEFNADSPIWEAVPAPKK